MIGQQIRLVFVGVPPSMNQFNGRTNVQVYRAVKADWTDRVTWQARARRPKRPFERADVLIEYQFQDNRRRDPDNYSGKFKCKWILYKDIIINCHLESWP